MTPLALAEPRTIQGDQFEHEAATVLRRLRAMLSALIGAIPSARINKAADLQRALDIPNTLAWQVFKLAQSEDPLADGSNVPGSAAMKRFFDAAEARGVRADIIEAGLDAMRAFQMLVKAHAGTRSAFDSMISTLDGNGSDQVNLQHKRAAYKANSHIWGVQAQTQLSCFMFQPSARQTDQLDFVALRGLLGLRRLRRDASWVVSHVRVADDDGQVRRPLNRSPIDPVETGSPGVSLLREFCSRPLPKFRSVMTESGFMNVELEPTSIGSRSAITCLIGDMYWDAFARYQDEHNQTHRAQTMVRTPCEALIHDVLVYEGTFGSAMPKLLVYGDHRNVDPALPGRACDLLATSESVVYLGKGASVLHTPNVPRYAEMAQYALDRAGWDGGKFDVFRCRVEFPVMPSSVVMQFDLPEKPDASEQLS